jgi:hypothetical protein
MQVFTLRTAVGVGVSARHSVRRSPSGRAYPLQAESEALDSGELDDIQVAEEAADEVTLRWCAVWCRSCSRPTSSRSAFRSYQWSLPHSRGRRVVSIMSAFMAMRRLIGSRNDVADSGWYVFCTCAPDICAAVIGSRDSSSTR